MMKDYSGSVLVSIGDSLAMPRNDQFSATSLENTWVNMAFSNSILENLQFHNSFGASSKDILRESCEVLGSLPLHAKSVFVIQYGIVDCTPRPLPRSLYFRAKRFFPRLDRYSFLHAVWGKPWVPEKRFKANTKKFLLRLAEHPSVNLGGVSW